MPDGVFGTGTHEHDTNPSFDFLKPKNIKDADGRKPDHPEYNPRTLSVPAHFIKVSLRLKGVILYTGGILCYVEFLYYTLYYY